MMSFVHDNLYRKWISARNKHFRINTVLAMILTGMVMSLPQADAATLTFPNYPLLGSGTPPTPNVLILYDNSFSMDSQMDEGRFKGGGDPDSRSNIARNSIRSILNSYHSKFNWGIETFQISGSDEACAGHNGLCNTLTTFEGDANTMVFTNDCVNGISNSHGGLHCTANLEPNGYNYITFSKGTDDGFGHNEIFGSYTQDWAWGTYAVGDSSGRKIDLFNHHNTAVQTWQISNDNSTSFSSTSDFKDPYFGPDTNYIVWEGCIDAGTADCTTTSLPRQYYKKVGWVFLKNFNGKGAVVEPIMSDSVIGHYSKLLNAMAPEAPDPNSSDIKNGAFETPLMGSFMTAYDYFSGTLPGSSSPIQSSCQKNYVLLATDGQPTADSNGKSYSESQMNNATTGKAYTDLYPKIQALRNTKVSGNTYDVQTYVLGIGDITLDPVAVAGLNKMAQYGGTTQAYLADDSLSMSDAFQKIIDGMGYTIPLRQSNGHIALSVTPIIQNTQIYKASFSNPTGTMWDGNVIKSTPKLSAPSGGGTVSYDTGEITGFDTGAAGWLKDNTVNGKPRQIITAARQYSKGALVGTPFSWSKIGTYTQGLLTNSGGGETSAVGNQRLNYVRGDRSNEVSTQNPHGFRKRDITVLGDIIDSSPVYVGPSILGFSDSDFSKGSESFNKFSQSVANRHPMVYVGANDGMLHGFDGNTLQEVFAYIPNAVISKLKLLSATSYGHEFYVNETPIVTDAVLPERGWTTQLIGFPGMGGTGLFALDVTSPDGRRASADLAHAENNASNIVLWELNGDTDADIGYILNRGQINRSHGGSSMQLGKMSNGRWAIITGNGYNSANNSTGLLIAYLDTVGGTPSYKKVMIPGVTGGLSTPTPIDVDFDGKVDYAYAGDLQGNVWRFDLRGDEGSWSAFKLFQITSGESAKPSPITTAPAVTYHCSKAGLMVMVGTGKYIESTDNNPSYADNHSDYLVGLWDKMDTTQIKAKDLVVQAYLQDTFVNNNNAVPDAAKSLILTTENDVDWNGGKRGWILQLYNQYPKPARIVVPPYVVDEMVYFNTISPDLVTCGKSTSWSTAQALQACTGQRPQRGVFDINFDGLVDNKDQYTLNKKPANVTGVNVLDQGRILDTPIWINPKAFTCKTPPCRSIQTGFNDPVGVKRSNTPTKRLSWKEIMQRY